VVEFSLEIFNSSITYLLSPTRKREAIAILNKKLPALASQPIRYK
jgi:hypothetical protein